VSICSVLCVCMCVCGCVCVGVYINQYSWLGYVEYFVSYVFLSLLSSSVHNMAQQKEDRQSSRQSRVVAELFCICIWKCFLDEIVNVDVSSITGLHTLENFWKCGRVAKIFGTARLIRDCTHVNNGEAQSGRVSE
jgi:arginine exporter protein ArgO